MPRQDVPYGGAICRLKERIAEIWDELGKKLHSINGVEGDGQGDVKLVSGDPAVVITDDQLQHEIEISLDTSQLPAAAVSSVNGQTGAVVLNADDLELINGAGVTAANAIITNGQRIAILQGNLNTEILERQNADSTLQGNINTLSASIPTAAATAVANDPTVAQLATDVPNKVDKITSGSSLKAYTHTGATQGETSVVDGTTANSIGIRDANGRMKGADPASGATDKTLVTANWVSQTGNSAPNNLVHKSGNETVNGLKMMADGLLGNYNQTSVGTTPDRWQGIQFKGVTTQFLKFTIVDYINNSSSRLIEGVMFWNGGSSNANVYTKIYGPAYTNPTQNLKVTIDSDNNFTFWVKTLPHHSVFSNSEVGRSWNSNIVPNFVTIDNPDWTTFQTVKEAQIL